MSAEFQIKCEELDQEYITVVGCRDLEVLAEVVQQDDVKNKVGEDFIGALREKMPESIYSIERYKNGKENDSPNGRPAWERFNTEGKLIKVRHLKHNIKHDSIHGEPAERIFSDDGSHLISESRYQNGQPCIGANGEPSVKIWNSKGILIHRTYHSGHGGFVSAPGGLPSIQYWYDDGTPREMMYYNDNTEPHHGPNGEPHKRQWNEKGELIYVEEFINGEEISKTHYDTEQSLAAKKEEELKMQKHEMLKEVVSKACPAVEFEMTVSPHVYGL